MNITGMPAAPDRYVDGSNPIGGSSAATRPDAGSGSVAGGDGGSGSVADGVGAGGADEPRFDADPAVRRYPSPVGELVLIAGPSGLAAVLWPDDVRPVRVGSGLDARSLVAEDSTSGARADAATGGAAATASVGTASGELPAGDAAALQAVHDEAAIRVQAVLEEAARQLDEYFVGSRFVFDLALDPVGTEFQVAVWRSLADIGYGETSTYGEQAARIGRPTAVRAVGAANGRNPLSIVLPCHRVVGSDGRLTGFAGGLEAKRFLLEHEARHRRP